MHPTTSHSTKLHFLLFIEAGSHVAQVKKNWTCSQGWPRTSDLPYQLPQSWAYTPGFISSSVIITTKRTEPQSHQVYSLRKTTTRLFINCYLFFPCKFLKNLWVIANMSINILCKINKSFTLSVRMLIYLTSTQWG